jgi:FG-GAP repeat
VYDNKTAGASRSASRTWSRAVAGLAATGVLLLAGATEAHAADAGGHSSNTGRAVSSLAGHRHEAMSPGAQLRLAQAPKGLRTAVREALGKSGAASAASAIQAKLLPRDANAQNVFGASIAVSGTTALVGATTANGGPGKGTGAAYVFVKGPAGWTQQARLAASDPVGTAKENLGFSVALDGDTAVIGAPNRGTFPGDPFGGSGAAYVYHRSGTKWSQQAILTETPSGGETGDFFGFSVAISGGTVLASAVGTAIPGHDVNSGGVFEYVRSGAAWPQVAKFAGADTAPGDAFGWDVALAGNTAVIGAPRNSASVGGGAYIFTKTGTGFAQRAELAAPDSQNGDLFGRSVALSGRTALVGAPGCCAFNPGEGLFRGAAYTFVRHDGRWASRAKLTARDGTPLTIDTNHGGDNFGESVALSGGTAVIGAPTKPKRAAIIPGGVDFTGAAYEFTRSGDAFTGHWSQTRKVTAADGARLDRLGFATAIAGGTGLVGAPFHNNNRGAVYLFGL